MKHLKILLVFLLVTIFCGTAWGFPLPSNYKMKLANLEIFNPSNASYDANPLTPIISAGDGVEDNWGIAAITNIFDMDVSSTSSVWDSGDTGGQEIRMLYWGLDITSWDDDPGNFTTGAASGGAGVSLWLWDQDDPNYMPLDEWDPLQRIGYTDFVSVTEDAGGNAAVQLADFTFNTSVDGNVTHGNTWGIPGVVPTGQGSGYLDVVANSGTIANYLDTNSRLGGSDVFFQFNFKTNEDPNSGFNMSSEDPLLGAAVPEPATMLLLGSGLIGLAGASRKRLRKKG